MRTLTFSKRTAKEILREPLYLVFGIGFPLGILLLLTALQSNLPIDIFQIDTLTPGISVFGLSFMALFSASLVSKDRSTSLLQRLYTTPMRSADYIIGYMIPLLPIGLAQTLICYGMAILLGLPIQINILYAIVLSIPISLFFIALGLLIGTLCHEKMANGLCGPLLTNLAAWLSGAWINLDLLGSLLKDIAFLMPFVHAVRLQQMCLIHMDDTFMADFLWVMAYASITLLLSMYLFTWKMKHSQ